MRRKSVYDLMWLQIELSLILIGEKALVNIYVKSRFFTELTLILF